MAEIKSFTTLEQSKKLAEILPLESADMLYIKREINDTFIETPIIKPVGDVLKSLPCWSLTALLKLMPAELDDGYYLTLDKESYKEFDEYCCCYEDCNGDSSYGFFGKNPVDACYEMVLKLNELKML